MKEMKLLKDLSFFAIMVDYHTWDVKEEKEKLLPCYLCIDENVKDKNGKPVGLFVFKEEITGNLRIFDTRKEAEEYIVTEELENSCCYENVRVVEIKMEEIT